MSDQLSTDDFAEVQAALWRARSQWYNIGVRLKMDTTELNVIDMEAGYKIKEKFNQMVQSWLKTTGPCTWKVLYKALKHPTVNMPDVAQEIKTNWMKKELQTFFEITPNHSEVKEKTKETSSTDESSPKYAEVKEKEKETDNNDGKHTFYLQSTTSKFHNISKNRRLSNWGIPDFEDWQ